MFNLPENNIHLAAQAENKQQVIEMVAAALEQAGYVKGDYLQGMLGRELQTSTYLGNGIAIPHGTLETRDMVKNTGVQIFQFPQGIEWGEGNTAYIVIGIAARSDEHLALLRQLTHVLGDEDIAAQLATLQDTKKFRAILMGESEDFVMRDDTLSLDVDTQSLLTLIAINAGQLQQQSAVDNSFISDVIADQALALGNGLWLTDSVRGNLKNAIAFSRVKNPFDSNGKKVCGVLTIAAKDDRIHETLARLLDAKVQNTLINGDAKQIVVALNDESDVSTQAAVQQTPPAVQSTAGNVAVGTFTLRNEHGLHARPAATLINLIKRFNAKITAENLTRSSVAVSAKSLMKIVALGATQGHRLRFVAEGEDALQALEALGKAIAEGLGEPVSAVPPAQPDTIEVQSGQGSVENSIKALSSDSGVEAIFTIKNDHGLHARPAALLVNEVKKYNASVAVQNLDRETQLVSAKSLMKIVALGVIKGHRLRFVATGEDAHKAIAGIGAAINSGLGE
ncbi:MAG TPA: bifunctional PTS fructose transporter subunit IIA/HPr protein [Pasteurellaceae bacterium]|nr:bifunctional PTS fructose transporter subunit IIA/HPr protein [Pasteurellaceae bacterium]